MSYVLAVDVGTSFTAAAVARFDQGTPSSAECLPLGLRGTSVPSVLFFPEEGPLLVGEAAERRGLDSPGRVVREFKRRVGDAVPISVGTLSLPAEEVFATMARWVADRAEEREGAPPSEIILTHPAAWGIHRTSLITDALAAKGLGNVTLLTEPEAAALHYASQVRVEDGSIIAVYDLGGGTFDTAVLRKAASNRFELLGRPEGFEYMGGADFDAALFRYVAEHTGGALAALDPAAPGMPASLARLQRECVEAKEALSSDSEANISVLLPGIHQQVRLVRPEFESLIEESVRDTVDALEQSLGQLGLEPADLTAVLLIGGSSRIPLVAQLISEQLDRPIAVDADPKSSICLGAAVSAVLGRAAAAEAAAAADAGAAEAPAETASTFAKHDYVPLTLAGWSRNAATASRSGAAAARPAGHAKSGGAHAPTPRVRLTAVATTAVLFTVLTATAAQSPEGFNSLTSVFVPPAGASDNLATLPPTGAGGAGGGGGIGAAAGAAGDSQIPPAGIESGMQRAASSEDAGLKAEAAPAGRVASIRVIEKEAAGDASSADAPAGPATSSSAATETPPGTGETTGSPTATTETPTSTPTTSETTAGPTSSTGAGTASGTATSSPTGTPSRASSGSPSGTGSPEPTTTQSMTEGSPSPSVQTSASPTVDDPATAMVFPGSDVSGAATATATATTKADTATTTAGTVPAATTTPAA